MDANGLPGLFITFEGGDGSGKSTQSRRLADWLSGPEAPGRAGGEPLEVVRAREPGGTELGLEIRHLVQHRRGHVAPRAEALLYAADRAHHAATVVRPALARGAVVVQDRYLDSSVAYQGAGRELDADEVRRLSLWATEGLLPDLTILLDLDPEVSRERLGAGDRVYDRLEEEGDGFPERVRAKYLELAAAEPARFLVLDATRAPDDLAAVIRARVSELLPTLGA